MSFVGPDGTATGVVVEILDAVAADVGFTIEHVIPVALGEMADALISNRIDITVSTYAITAERVTGPHRVVRVEC